MIIYVVVSNFAHAEPCTETITTDFDHAWEKVLRFYPHCRVSIEAWENGVLLRSATTLRGAWYSWNEHRGRYVVSGTL